MGIAIQEERISAKEEIQRLKEETTKEISRMLAQQAIFKQYVRKSMRDLEKSGGVSAGSAKELKGRIDLLEDLLGVGGSSVRASDSADKAITALDQAEASLAALAHKTGSVKLLGGSRA